MSEKRKYQKKEDAGVGKGRKVAKHSVFPIHCGSGGPTSRLARAARAEPLGHIREAKVHALVAQSTCRSQYARSIHMPGPFLELEGVKNWRFLKLGCVFAWQARGFCI